jgi:trehalose-6-phosphate synthase
MSMADSDPLIIVSNRGPAQFERDEAGERTVQRGGGGLVTALSGLVSHREALWIASAMTAEDVAVSEEEGGPVELSIDGIDYRVLLVDSDAEAYDRFYNVIANPILWFVQHYLWDLSNAPDVRQEELDAWDYGYQAVNRDIARAVLGQIEDRERPLVMLHDYHLYTAPGMIRAQRPDAFLHHFVHIPWTQPDCLGASARRSSAACSPTTSSASTRTPTASTSSAAATNCWRPTLTTSVAWCATPAARRCAVPTRSRSMPSGCGGRPNPERSPSTSASCSAAGAST